MDPNELLKMIREDIQEADNAKSTDDFIHHSARLSEHVKYLDEWLTRGGFVPGEWGLAHNME